MRPSDTCIVLAARMAPCGSFEGIARGRLRTGLALGIILCLVLYLVARFGLTGWTGQVTLGLPMLGILAWPLLAATVTAMLAMLRVRDDAVMDESLVWARCVDLAMGTVTGETPPEYRAIRPWPPVWALWTSLPMGWVVLLALLLRDVARMYRTCRTWTTQQRVEYCAKASQCLYGLASAIDATTLRPASGTWFGCLVHPQSHADRSAHILNDCLGGLGLVLVPGFIWLGTILAGMGFGYVWGTLLVSHLVGAVAVWFLGVVRVRLQVALAWDRQTQELRFTLRPATSERDMVMRVIEDSTWETI